MKRCKRFLSSMFAIAFVLTTLLSTGITVNGEEISNAQISVNNLTVEYVEAPQGIDADAPRFGWKLASNQVGAVQRAYQVVVKDADGNLAWDSGMVNSDKSISVNYAGETALSPETDYAFTVTVWDNYGNQASADSSFSTGVEDWEGARIISPAGLGTGSTVAMLRSGVKTLQNKAVASAKLYMTAFGIYSAYINGQEVAPEQVFSPGWVHYTDYNNYQTYDVTDYISGNRVVVAAELAKGWYGGRLSSSAYNNILSGGATNRDLGLYGKLVVTYEDGSKDVIVTDNSWRCNINGPVYDNEFWTSSNFAYGSKGTAFQTGDNPFLDVPLNDRVTGGEKYDESREIPGWNEVDFTISMDNIDDWPRAAVLTWNKGYYDENELRSSNGAAAAYWEETRSQYPQADSSYVYTYGNVDYSNQTLDYGEVVIDKYVDLAKEDVTLQPGEVMILNLGQNITGTLEVDMTGAPDADVVFSHIEMLNDGRKNPNTASGGSQGAKGTLYYDNLRGEKTATYNFDSDGGRVTYKPKWTYFGFQYIQITANKPITIHSAVGKVITSAAKQTGDITTNNTYLNKLFSNVLWSQMDNFTTIPTDCPQRNERVGWTGDIQLFAETGVYNFDSVAFLENYIKIMDNHAARTDNRYGAVMPAGAWGSSTAHSGWSDAGILIPWVVYQQTGDIGAIAGSFDQMDKYMDAIGDNGAGYSLSNYGDWVALQACSLASLNAIYRAYDAQVMAKMASALGYEDKTAKYEQIFENTKTFFMNKYYTYPDNNAASAAGVTPGEQTNDLLSAMADNFIHGESNSNNGGKYVDNAQTAISWALKLGFYRDEAHKQYLLSKLMESIKNEGGSIRPGYAEDTLAVGFLGLNVILPSLSGAGQGEYAFKLLQQDQFPSWLYSVKSGATSIWERWNSYSIDDSFLAPSMNSFNHFSFGACIEWVYEEVVGINKDELNPGFKHINLTPTVDPTGGLNDVSGSYDSYYGTIEAGWTADAGIMTSYNAVVPANTSATLYLPVSDDYTVNNLPQGVTFLGMTQYNDSNAAAFELESGGFNFEMTDNTISVSVADGYVSSGASPYHDLLGKTIADAQAAMDTDEYENMLDSLKAEYEAALAEAIALYNNANATEDDLFNMFLKVSDMINKLGFQKGDKTILLRLIQACDLYNLDLYTPATVEVLKQALSKAKEVYLDGDTVQGDVNNAVEQLRNAMNGLRYRANKDVLIQAINKAQGLNLSSYTAESVESSDFVNVLKSALIVLDNPNAEQEETDASAKAMNAAIDLLVPIDTASGESSNDNGASSDTSDASNDTSSTASNNAKMNSPKTGDTLLIFIIPVLLIASGAVALSRKKRF